MLNTVGTGTGTGTKSIARTLFCFSYTFIWVCALSHILVYVIYNPIKFMACTLLSWNYITHPLSFYKKGITEKPRETIFLKTSRSVKSQNNCAFSFNTECYFFLNFAFKTFWLLFHCTLYDTFLPWTIFLSLESRRFSLYHS